jgi:large subunit ribosomal protein L30
MENLHLDKKFRATIIPENDQTLGMLRKIKELVSWTSVDQDFIKEFLEKKGRISGSSKSSEKSNTKDNSNNKDNKTGGDNDIKNKDISDIDIDKIATTISQNQTYLSKISGIKPWFALNPPRGGFKKKSKRSYSQDGILGENKELVSLVKRMM